MTPLQAKKTAKIYSWIKQKSLTEDNIVFPLTTIFFALESSVQRIKPRFSLCVTGLRQTEFWRDYTFCRAAIIFHSFVFFLFVYFWRPITFGWSNIFRTYRSTKYSIRNLPKIVINNLLNKRTLFSSQKSLRISYNILFDECALYVLCQPPSTHITCCTQIYIALCALVWVSTQVVCVCIFREYTNNV